MEEDQIDEAIEDCLNALPAVNCPFTEWEYDFVESVAEQWEKRQSLTEKQQEALGRIWDKV